MYCVVFNFEDCFLLFRLYAFIALKISTGTVYRNWKKNQFTYWNLITKFETYEISLTMCLLKTPVPMYCKNELTGLICKFLFTRYLNGRNQSSFYALQIFSKLSGISVILISLRAVILDFHLTSSSLWSNGLSSM